MPVKAVKASILLSETTTLACPVKAVKVSRDANETVTLAKPGIYVSKVWLTPTDQVAASNVAAVV